MRRVPGGRSAEDPGAGPSPGAPRGWRAPLPPLRLLCFLFLVPHRPPPPISPPFCSGFLPWWPSKGAGIRVNIAAPVSPRAPGLRADAPGVPLFISLEHYPPTHLLFLFFLSLFSPFCMLCSEEEKGARKRGGGWVEGEKIRFLITTIKKSNLQFFGRPDGSH